MLNTEKLDQIHKRLAEQLKEADALFKSTFTLQAEMRLVPMADDAVPDGEWVLGFSVCLAGTPAQLYVYSLDQNGQPVKTLPAHEAPQGVRALASLAVPKLYALLTKSEERLVKAHEDAAKGMTAFLAAHGSSAAKVGE